MSRLMAILLVLAALGLAACGTDDPSPVTAPEAYRLDLGAGVVAAFVKGQSTDVLGKVAYITHVPSGSQAVLDGEGTIIRRHDGSGRLDAVLADDTVMARIIGSIQSDDQPQDSRRVEMISWVPLVQFSGIRYVKNWESGGGVLTVERFTELYRVAFKVDGHAESSYLTQDGDATYLSVGTPIYAIRGYSSKFRLATVEGGEVTIDEADTNPQAKFGEDLLDIREKVTAIDILSEEDGTTVLGKIDDESSISRFVEAVLASPVDQESRDREGKRYFLGFQLADGTSLVRSFWTESGLLSRGIMTDPAVALFVSSALSLHGRGASTGVTDPVGDSSTVASWVPTPESIQRLVNVVDAVAISVVLRLDREVVEGPYDASFPSQTGNAEAPRRFPYSYYEFEIRDLLLGDGYISDNRLIKLKGHAGDGALSRRISLPEPGDRFVFFLSRNPDNRSYSFLGPWAMISTDTGAPTQFGGTHAVPAFAQSLNSDEFLEVVRSSIGTRAPTAPLSGVTVIGAHGGSASPVGQLAATPMPTPRPTGRVSLSPTPTPAVIPGQPQVDRAKKAEQRRREAMANFPDEKITWIDQDTLVYVLSADPHDLSGPKVAVAQHLPTGAALNYELDDEENLLNQYQGGMCISGVLTTTERTPRHFILPLGPN